MPLLRLDLPDSVTPDEARALADAAHAALVTHMDVPADDRFQVIARHPPGGLVIDRNYLGIARSDRASVLQVTLRAGRSLDQKQRFLAEYARRAGEAGWRAADLVVVIHENTPADWSFGEGVAQYAPVAA